ncbi:hypothetical protein FHL15_007045 [Xylaria flabelliformis]|uniref:Heterokaryon incompatibility domain-containing protein n=1 Tax=Xylaria flabelliformis TaxID=2512241 RepID=A0A553HW64_9PEZI|nr:hypothetical protein FHL15_007045 [Xylaria flabelliformis]
MLEYQPLAKAQIRLLTIEPGRVEDAIRCSLTTVSLDDKLKYEALSYVWGDPTITQDIFVNVFAKTDRLSKALRHFHLRDRPDHGGVAVPVTRNLFTALRRFRRCDKRRTMWVDALCINQQDLNERSSQVLLMSRIYSQCRSCQAWLGEEGDITLRNDGFSPKGGYGDRELSTPSTSSEYASLRYYIETEKIHSINPIDDMDLISDGRFRPQLSVPGAFALLKLMAENAWSNDMCLFKLPFYRITEFPEFEFCPQWHNARLSLISICSRDWWQRTWTVQEAVIPEDCVINIGGHQAPLWHFLSAYTYIDRHRFHSCCGLVIGDLWHPKALEEPNLVEMFENLDQLGSVKQSYKRNRKLWEHEAPQGLNLYEEPNEPNGASLWAYKKLARQRQATDPRDVVYGYLGIFPDLLPVGHKPDYVSETVESVYTKATKQHIIKEELYMLKSVLPPFQRARKDLPSWAVDWSRNMDPGCFVYWKPQNANGEFDSYERADLFQEPLVLPIDAMAIGTIIWTSNMPSGNHKVRSVLKKLRLWQQAAGIWWIPQQTRRKVMKRIARLAKQAVTRKMARAKRKAMREISWERLHSRRRAAAESATVSQEERAFRFWRTIYQANPEKLKKYMREYDMNQHKLNSFTSRFVDQMRSWLAFLQSPRQAGESMWTVDWIYPEDKECWTDLWHQNLLGTSVWATAFSLLKVPGVAEPMMANCMKGVRPGDVVVVAKGMNVPMVLREIRTAYLCTSTSSSFETGFRSIEIPEQRPLSSSGTLHPRTRLSSLDGYNFLGLAYVDGIMDGEAVSEKSEWQSVRLV